MSKLTLLKTELNGYMVKLIKLNEEYKKKYNVVLAKYPLK